MGRFVTGPNSNNGMRELQKENHDPVKAGIEREN